MVREPPPSARRRSTSSVPIFYPDWLVLQPLGRDIADALDRFGRGTLLDLGCGSRPFERASSKLDAWVGLDLPDNPLADLHGPADAIPMGDGSVDTILCSQVLEHVDEPSIVLAECHRVLRPGGSLILSVPQYWPLHEEPRDFYRYTEYGLRHLLGVAGFSIATHYRQGCGAAVAGQALNNAILCAGDTFSFKERLWFKASKAPLYLAINLASAALARVLKTPRDVLNHVFVARKE